MAVAATLAERAAGLTGGNPPVGCVIVRDNIVIGRGWTQAGGRPHAEAMALTQAGEAASGADIYVTLEPCAHQSERGPPCAQSLIEAGVRRVFAAWQDPDPRTAGKGFALLRGASIETQVGIGRDLAAPVLAGFFSRMTRGRPHITLKLATSLDGLIAMLDGSSRWITGDAARRHAHLERARADAILVGGGTYRADAPRLDVRIAGMEARSPKRILLSKSKAPDGWIVIGTPEEATALGLNRLLVEGGATTASAFLKAGLVDRLLLYRAPILIGAGRASLADIGLASLADAHRRWTLADKRQLGNDCLEVYERAV
jgi:diaminohydroxyphosphoribosylaminopyrimidine deaminase / 5-amino-6-(5-phosphoribosylamino)uracil reductase